MQNSANSQPVLLKIGQRCVLARKMDGLTGRKGGSSANVALSWQLSNDKTGQGSAATEQREATAAYPADKFYGSHLHVVIGFKSSSRACVWEEVRRESCRDPSQCCQFPGVDESTYAAFQWQTAEDVFFCLKKKSCTLWALNNISSYTDWLFAHSMCLRIDVMK